MQQNPLSYLNSLGLHKVKPGLDRINTLLEALGNPQDKTPCVIVGGTNGKGSVASSVSTVLTQAGYKTGLYTSPHLVSVTERIRINGTPVGETELSDCINRIRLAGEENLKEELSYFELLTAAAFLYFSEKELDLSVLEVGMGGRWDATNVTRPLISVITNISKEHTEYLGSSIREIAQEKACIINPDAPVVTGARGEALDVITLAAEENSSDLSVLGKDFNVDEEANGRFSYSGSIWKISNLDSSMHGLYQLENLALAVRVLEKLVEAVQIRIEEDILRKGLSRISWEGRFEIVRDDPPFILDSAHNPGAARALAASLEHSFPGVRFTFLIGMLGDKDHSAFIEEIAAVAEKIIITQAPSERGASTYSLSEAARKNTDNVVIIDSYDEACRELINSDVPVCVTGSLYLIGALKPLILTDG